MSPRLHQIRPLIEETDSSLEDLDLFTEVTWIQWREAGEKATYFFSPDGEYLFRRGRFARQGQWKVLKDDEHIILEYEDLEGRKQHLTYRLLYLDESVFILEIPDVKSPGDSEILILTEPSFRKKVTTEDDLLTYLRTKPKQSGLFNYVVYTLIILVFIMVVFSLC